MKADELLKHAECSLCRRKIGHTGLPCFWIVKIERHGINLAAARRQDALGELLGSHALARVMGPNEEMTRPLMEPITLTVCETCAVCNDMPVAVMAEVRNERAKRRSGGSPRRMIASASSARRQKQGSPQ